MKKIRSTKIVATLGPASSSPETIFRLCQAGVNVFRLNSSHGTPESHKQAVDNIRKAEEKFGQPIAIMFDLQGPKLRIGTFVNNRIDIEVNQRFQLDLNPNPGNNERVYFAHEPIFKSLIPGANVLIDDGKVSMIVEEQYSDRIVCKVVNGHELSNNKGVNLPNVPLAIGAMTEKDEENLKLGVEWEVDWIAVSFVQSEIDIQCVREKIPSYMKIIAKLEKPLAISNLDSIIQVSDGIMVARGDLGVELPLEQIPKIQKSILRECHFHGKPVVVATQMLDSMVASPVPTRAEVSDVANAIFDGADAVMLSAESASGNYPVESVEIMDRIIREVEKDTGYLNTLRAHAPFNEKICSTFSFAAPQIIDNSEVTAVALLSNSGVTAVQISRERPKVPIIAICNDLHSARYLSLIWGVKSYFTESDKVDTFDTIMEVFNTNLHKSGLFGPSDDILILSGCPEGFTSEIKFAYISKLL